MRLLSVECSGFSGAVAIHEHGSLVAAAAVPADQRMAAGLAPLVARTLAAAGWRPADVGVVAVTHGPGSFTGLRIGLAFVKTFAYAVGAAVVAVDTMDVVAAQAPPDPDSTLHVVFDAQRRQSYVAPYELDASGAPGRRGEPRIVDDATWLAELPSGTRLAGPGLAKWKGRLRTDLTLADPSTWEPSVEVVGRIAWRAFQAGATTDPFRLAPQYYRPSAAEEKKNSPAT